MKLIRGLPLSPAQTQSGHQETTPAPCLSIIIPMRNESDNLAALFARIYSTLDDLQLTFEIICVDDGSTDETWRVLERCRQGDPRLRLIRLSRNFGKEMAVLSGLHRCRGQAAVIMDADLQHPPELIERFVAHWREGYQVVYGVRASRKKEGWGRKLPAYVFYWIFSHLTELPLPQGITDFRLMDRTVIEAINAMPERNRFLKGLAAWTGFSQIAEPFEVAPRRAGLTGWGFIRLWRYAFDALTGFSTLPLRLWFTLGVLLSGLSVTGLGLLGLHSVVTGAQPTNSSLILGAMFFLGGLQLMALGVIGEYLGRVFTEVKGRPPYVVAVEHGFAEALPAASVAATSNASTMMAPSRTQEPSQKMAL